MPRTYDDRRWTLNEDGTFTRKITPEEPIAVAPEEKSEAYYEDISTTGAAADRAHELGVDLSTVKGTGKNGRITKADVEAAA
jgi:pyruvate/2-oxoglutarate dehydrogenase complex dihydrolipoamide acyltransferase (E2) component